jgi:hypothetical protein
MPKQDNPLRVSLVKKEGYVNPHIKFKATCDTESSKLLKVYQRRDNWAFLNELVLRFKDDVHQDQ